MSNNPIKKQQYGKSKISGIYQVHVRNALQEAALPIAWKDIRHLAQERQDDHAGGADQGVGDKEWCCEGMMVKSFPADDPVMLASAT